VIERNVIEKFSELMYPEGVYVKLIPKNISKVFSYGITVYSSAFFLNSILPRVCCKWENFPF